MRVSLAKKNRRTTVAIAMRRGMVLPRRIVKTKTVTRIVHKVQVKVKIKVQHVSVTTYQILADLLNTGDSFAAIGKRTGLTRQRVSQINEKAIKAGIAIPRRPKGRPPK